MTLSGGVLDELDILFDSFLFGLSTPAFSLSYLDSFQNIFDSFLFGLIPKYTSPPFSLSPLLKKKLHSPPFRIHTFIFFWWECPTDFTVFSPDPFSKNNSFPLSFHLMCRLVRFPNSLRVFVFGGGEEKKTTCDSFSNAFLSVFLFF